VNRRTLLTPRSRHLFALPPPSSQFFVHLITRGIAGNLFSTDSISSILTRIEAEDSEITNVESLLRARKPEVKTPELFELKLLREFVGNWVKWAATVYPRSLAKRGVSSVEVRDPY
jgi:hypothetical protein